MVICYLLVNFQTEKTKQNKTKTKTKTKKKKKKKTCYNMGAVRNPKNSTTQAKFQTINLQPLNAIMCTVLISRDCQTILNMPT